MRKAVFGALLLFCTACASPSTQPSSVAAQTSPELASESLDSADDTELPLRSWLPAGKPKAAIIGLHGFNDYSRAFEIPAKKLARKGFAVYAYDQRGFGETPQHGIWAGQKNLVQDAARMVSAVRKRHPHTPVYILGESMGGAVAITAITTPGFPKVDGLILSAPAVWGSDTMNPLWRASLWVFAHTWPGKTLTGEDLHVLASDNIPMLRALSCDPLVIKRTRVDAIYGLVHLMDTASNRVGAVHVPVLLLYGAHDQVIPPEPIARALSKSSTDVTVGYYPKGYHMLLRDLHREAPLEDIAAWIDDHETPLPSGDERDSDKLEAMLEHREQPTWPRDDLRVVR